MAKSNIYMLWQYDVKEDINKEVDRAIAHYVRRHGKPPTLLEYSNKIEPIKLSGMVGLQVKVPSNIFLLGE